MNTNAKTEFPDGFGSGHYDIYPYYWHLKKIGVVTDDAFTSAAWDAAESNCGGSAPTRVVMIDNSVAASHPNLTDAVNQDLAVDFFTSPTGVFWGDATAVNALATAASGVADAVAAGFPAFADLITKYRQRLSDDAADSRDIEPAWSEMFSAHGTAIAGLIGARPPLSDDPDPVVRPEKQYEPSFSNCAAGSGKEVENLGVDPLFSYAGVDPFCEVVPVSTNFDADPEQFILALLHAELVGAQVIVIPRDFADPFRSHRAIADTYPAAYPVEIPDETKTLWTVLHDYIVALSKTVPIVCAAGNGGDNIVIYPASLSAADNGIIAVGAHNCKGLTSGYSPAGVDVEAPSSDGERYDTGLRRLDEKNPDFNYEEYTDDPDTFFEGSDFEEAEIITTDVPGRGGYNPSEWRDNKVEGEEDVYYDIESYFCQFGGTSAASAITAGFLSLIISAGKDTWSGPHEIKSGLFASGKLQWPDS